MAKTRLAGWGLSAHGATTVPFDASNNFEYPLSFLWTKQNQYLKFGDGSRLLLKPIEKVIYREQPTIHGRITIREKYYVPTNPRTDEQQANRTLFADAVEAWQNLSYQEEIVWNKMAYPPYMSGYNRFIRNYLKTHTPVLPTHFLLVNIGSWFVQNVDGDRIKLR